jgi:predicted DNA-binding protein (MmcQ/YjbR family)
MKSKTKDPETVLHRIRTICLSLPDAEERTSWGHPTFTVQGRPFAVFEQYKGEWCVCSRVELPHQELFLKDPRFLMTPYIGKQGWVSLRVYAAPLNWTEIAHLLTESHRLLSSLPKSKRAKARA